MRQNVNTNFNIIRLINKSNITSCRIIWTNRQKLTPNGRAFRTSQQGGRICNSEELCIYLCMIKSLHSEGRGIAAGSWAIIFVFALLHAAVALVSRMIDYYDDVPLTVLTITMVIVVAMRQNVRIEIIAVIDAGGHAAGLHRGRAVVAAGSLAGRQRFRRTGHNDIPHNDDAGLVHPRRIAQRPPLQELPLDVAAVGGQHPLDGHVDTAAQSGLRRDVPHAVLYRQHHGRRHKTHIRQRAGTGRAALRQYAAGHKELCALQRQAARGAQPPIRRDVRRRGAGHTSAHDGRRILRHTDDAPQPDRPDAVRASVRRGISHQHNNIHALLSVAAHDSLETRAALGARTQTQGAIPVSEAQTADQPPLPVQLAQHTRLSGAGAAHRACEQLHTQSWPRYTATCCAPNSSRS